MKTSIKILIVAALAAVVVGALVLKNGSAPAESEAMTPTVAAAAAPGEATTQAVVATTARLPRLVDLGADKCIPCKMMAPILDEFKRNYADQFSTEFIDVWKNPAAGTQYGVEMIPTQIFFDAQGRELFRHVGFYGKEDILNKWRELGVMPGPGQSARIVRDMPVAPDVRARDQVCYLCDGDVNPKSKTVVKGEAEQRVLCSTHCYFIYFSSLVGADPEAEDAKVRVTDWSDGTLLGASAAAYLYSMDNTGRPTIKAFGTREAALEEQSSGSGNLVDWDLLRSKEMATRCAFCDRAVYPEDACRVRFGSAHGYGCCTHCALGVAARLRQDIEVEAKDSFSGDSIRVKTMAGQVATIEPPTAVAWFGQKRNSEGQWVSAGCFKQGFFVNQDTLKQWLEEHPTMTGREISIAQALADKMKLTPEQIAKACKLGECK
jgi:thioredoxin 1